MLLEGGVTTAALLESCHDTSHWPVLGEYAIIVVWFLSPEVFHDGMWSKVAERCGCGVSVTSS
jgi:hypothetical protein